MRKNPVYHDFIVHHREDDSLKKLRRDRGKIEEIIAQLILALERRGGTMKNLFSLLEPGENSTVSLFHSIAGLLMGELRLVRIDPLEVLTKTGKSDAIRCYAVTAGGIKEEDLPVDLLVNKDFYYPLTSIAMVERISDQKKLKRIALEDDHYGRTLAGAMAVDKLTSPADLYAVAMQATHQTAMLAIERLVNENLLDQNLLGKVVEDGRFRDIAEVAIAKLTDKKVLLDLYAKGLTYISVENRLFELGILPDADSA